MYHRYYLVYVKKKTKQIFCLALAFFLEGACPANSETSNNASYIKGGALIASAMAAMAKSSFEATPQCYWCSINDFDLKIGRAWTLANLNTARFSSNLLTFGVLPALVLAGTLFSEPSMNHAFYDLIVIFSSASITLAATEMIKTSARRMRPETFFGYSNQKYDNNRSFPSGHTSFAFAILTSSSLLLSKRTQSWSPYFGLVSAAAGGLVAYSRIAAAKHWMTDVLAAMSLGIAVGSLMPRLIFHEDNQNSPFYLLPDLESAGLQFGLLW